MNQAPQHSLFFKVVAIFSKMQLRYLHRTFHNGNLLTAIHLFCAGVTGLSTIAILAYLTDLMLLFPPLGPSAFILFYTPLSETASPRNLILSHMVALLSGLGASALAALLFPEFIGAADLTMNWSMVTAIGIAMGAVSVSMVAMQCVHPPAAATALIAAMGYFNNTIQIASVVLAVLFLALEAILFNRLLGGLPYPFWRFDPKVERSYRSLAGYPSLAENRWQKLAEKTFQRR